MYIEDPATLPRPAVSVLPFQLPMCEMDKEKSQYEVNIVVELKDVYVL